LLTGPRAVVPWPSPPSPVQRLPAHRTLRSPTFVTNYLTPLAFDEHLDAIERALPANVAFDSVSRIVLEGNNFTRLGAGGLADEAIKADPAAADILARAGRRV
jgi:hypothetical protein